MGSIRQTLANARAGLGERRLWTAASAVRLADLGAASCLDRPAESLADRSVVIATRDQFTAALTLTELDGVVRRLMLCAPDVAPDQLALLAARTGADTIVTDGGSPPIDLPVHVRCLGAAIQYVRCHSQPGPHFAEATGGERATEWVLLTSGTAAAAKLVRHTFSTLTGAIAPPAVPASTIVWGTFYDIRRYGGLQVFLRVLVGGGSLVVGAPGETTAQYLDRLAAHGVTHLSGTPSHWRRVLMSPGARSIAPRYIRLSGEIADQGILDALRSRYPEAQIVHAFASTEAGVGFEVDDGLAGFSAGLLDRAGDVRLRVDDGSLRIRSSRTAIDYVGGSEGPLADADGFVDTGDVVERREDRYYFLGRRSGVINVGGLKVHPEEVEAAINRHPSVRMSKVRPKPSPITGSLVAADVVLEQAADVGNSTSEILEVCRRLLPAHKIPAVIRIVPTLEIGLTGKLVRHAG
jgi:acyl-coenzyme A synthetase/AMP-(fatty) acid ligase